MPHYEYQGGFCGYCGASLGRIEQNGGRNRRYCNDKHKMAAFHEKRKGEKRNAAIERNKILRDQWQENGITGEVLTRLQDILVDHGKDAAKKATDTVLIAIKQARKGV